MGKSFIYVKIDVRTRYSSWRESKLFKFDIFRYCLILMKVIFFQARQFFPSCFLYYLFISVKPNNFHSFNDLILFLKHIYNIFGLVWVKLRLIAFLLLSVNLLLSLSFGICCFYFLLLWNFFFMSNYLLLSALFFKIYQFFICTFCPSNPNKLAFVVKCIFFHIFQYLFILQTVILSLLNSIFNHLFHIFLLLLIVKFVLSAGILLRVNNLMGVRHLRKCNCLFGLLRNCFAQSGPGFTQKVLSSYSSIRPDGPIIFGICHRVFFLFITIFFYCLFLQLTISKVVYGNIFWLFIVSKQFLMFSVGCRARHIRCQKLKAFQSSCYKSHSFFDERLCNSVPQRADQSLNHIFYGLMGFMHEQRIKQLLILLREKQDN